MMLFMALTGSYINETIAAKSTEGTMPKFLARPLNHTPRLGETIKIVVVVEGTPFPDVRFYNNGRRIYSNDRTSISIDSKTVTLTIKNVRNEDAGQYKIVAENVIGMEEVSCEVIISII